MGGIYSTMSTQAGLLFLCGVMLAHVGQCLGASPDDVTIHQIEQSLQSTEEGRVWTPCCSLEHRKTKAVPGPAMQVSKRVLSEEQLEQLVALAESDGIYQVRLKSSRDGPYVMAFAPACSLLASNLKEQWHLTVDQFDNVIAIDTAPRRADCSKLDLTKWRRGGDHVIDTTAKLVHPWRGIRPEVKTSNKPLKKVPKGPSGRPQGGGQPQDGGQPQYEDEEPQEPQSFLRKYWLYIVIPIIYLLLSSLPQEEGKAAGAAGASKKAR